MLNDHNEHNNHNEHNSNHKFHKGSGRPHGDMHHAGQHSHTDKGVKHATGRAFPKTYGSPCGIRGFKQSSQRWRLQQHHFAGSFKEKRFVRSLTKALLRSWFTAPLKA
jgi:hypothetical protein